MEIIACEQRSEAWYAARAGKPTASQFHRIMTPKKRTLSVQHVGYMYELIAEKFYGKAIEEDLSHIPAVRYGIDHEPRRPSVVSCTHRVANWDMKKEHTIMPETLLRWLIEHPYWVLCVLVFVGFLLLCASVAMTFLVDRLIDWWRKVRARS